MQFTSVASQIPSCIRLNQEKVFSPQVDVAEVTIFMSVEAGFRWVSTVKALQLLPLGCHQGEEECPPELEHPGHHVYCRMNTCLLLLWLYLVLKYWEHIKAEF